MIAALTALLLLAPAQDNNDALKKKILQDVEKRLKAQEERLLKDIERVIDEELGRPKAAAPAPKPDAPKAEAPKKGRGYMGVRPGDLSDEEKAELKIKSGIKVVEVVEGGPGEKAGLRKDDVITAIDGKPVDSPQEVPAIVQAAGAGAKLKVDILRAGEKKSIDVTLGKHPLDEQQGKAEPPKEGDLRERLKKFKEAEPKQDPPKATPAPKKAEPKKVEPKQED
ncbi:MAG TPA: PDZ domain-containing protein, partial [Planctomycetota bacterium]